MIIHRIQMNGFGNLKDKTIEFEHGINLIYGNNEAGKSTLAKFMKAMFYGVNKNKAGGRFSELEQYKPWSEADFSGTMEYEISDKKYIATREFNKNACKVYDEQGNDITNSFNKDKSRGTEIGFEQLGIDEDTFVNSVFVSQKNIAVSEEGQKTLTQKITNMIQSGEESVSYDKLKQKLQKVLLDEVGTERTHNKPLNTTMKEISLLEESKESLIKNRDRQGNIANLLNEIDKKQETVAKDLEKASRVLEIKQRYEDLLKERENDYEISVKIIDKEYENTLEKRKKSKENVALVVGAITIILASVCILFGHYFVSSGISIIGLLALWIVHLIFSKEIEKPTYPNFDVVKEDFKKKEEKELYFLKKEGIGESLSSRKIQDVRDLISGLKKKKEDLILEKHKLNIEVESLKENIDRLNEIEERLDYLYEQETDLRKLEFSLKLAMQKLTESYEELKADVIPKLENMIKQSIIETTHGQYTNVYYNEANGLMVQNEKGDIITIDKLSVGTIEQAYLGFRLAISKELADLPLIFDETFVYYDNTRLENVLKLFHEKYEDRQIIILSCSHREKEMLENLKIPYHLIEM